MKHKIESFFVQSIGGKDGPMPTDWAWIKLALSFGREQEEFHPALDLLVGVKYDDGSTIRDVQNGAIREAKDLLAAAMKALDDNDLEQLRRLSAESGDRLGQP